MYYATYMYMFAEFLIKDNPAYSQGMILQTSSSNQAHEYETPVVFRTNTTSLVTISQEYVPRLVHTCNKSNDYEVIY